MVRWELYGALMMALTALVACSRDKESPPAPTSSGAASPTAVASASAAASNDGTDPKAPVLSPDDTSFVDMRKGGGWGDRCFTEIKQGKWGWAHAACDRALALPDVDAKVRPLLLYNEGLIAKHAGDNTAARNYFGQSLSLRSPTDPGRSEVEKELTSVGGTPTAAAATHYGVNAAPLVETFTGKGIEEVLSTANVQAPSNLDFATLYHADINNDGWMEFILCETNPTGLHNTYILAIYNSAPSGLMLSSETPVLREGPFVEGNVYDAASPFLRADPEGITMTFLEGQQRARYLWKGGHIRLLDRR
jgi:hypothetical protein